MDRIVDVDFDTNLPVTQAVLKENGAIAGYASASVPEPTLPFYALMFKNITIRLVLVYSMPDEAKRQACKDINRAIKGGKLIHTIAARFPLEQLADAHVAVESGTHIGKVVIEIEGEPL